MIVQQLFYLTLFLLFLSCTPQKEKVEVVASPNIVIILADDQGWGDLSFTGNPVVKTPIIDKLAHGGIVFDHFYVDAVCSPTRAAMLTGRYAVRGGVYSTSAGGERLDLDETTFAKILQEAGYKTGAFGKWHNGMQPPYHPNARGFDEFYGYCSGHWGSYFNAMLERNGKLISSEGYLTDVLTDRAMDFIEMNQNKPFLVYLPLNTPHSPMQVPDRWWKKFENMDLPEHRYSEREDVNHTRAAYAMAENIDWNVGRVTEKLGALDLMENTLVIYFSDNGPNGWRWNGGMEGTKGSVDEGGVRSPMVMYWKDKLQGGKVITEIASVLDLFPTLLDIAGIKNTEGKILDGQSLKPLLMEEDAIWSDRILVNHWRGNTSVRSQNFRLDAENRLFNMQDDPSQLLNVEDSFPEENAALLAAKKDWEVNILSELPEQDNRSFTIGHTDFVYNQIPARDFIAHGNIQRSNRWPNCSFYTNWISKNDSLTLEVEVLEDGLFEAVLYYTCRAQDVGTIMELSFKNQAIQATITEAYDPPLRGMEHDRISRQESYVKDFKPVSMGNIQLKKGKGTLKLKGIEIIGEQAIDFRLLMLERIE